MAFRWRIGMTVGEYRTFHSKFTKIKNTLTRFATIMTVYTNSFANRLFVKGNKDCEKQTKQKIRRGQFERQGF